MGKLYDSQGNRKGSWSYSQGIQSQESDLEKLLGIAQDADVEPPKDKPGLLNRILGALRASETSGIAHDVQQGEGLGSALKNYGRRIGKGWTLQGLDEEDLGVPGYKEVLEERGVSSKPWFEAGPLKPSTAGTLGLAGDIFLDPLTYLSFGTTAAGKQAGKTATREIAQELGEKGAIKTLAREGGEEAVEKLGRTGAEQALKGQKGLVNFMGKPIVPKKASAKAYQTVDDLVRKTADTRLGRVAEATRDLFKTDAMPSRFRGVPELEDQWRKFTTAKNLAKNTERSLTEFGKEKGKEFYEMAVEQAGGRKFFGKGAPKDIDKVTDIMDNALNAFETGAKDAPDYVKPLVDEMKKYSSFIEEQWKNAGGRALSDDTVNYWLRTLTQEERDKLLKSAGYGGAREFSSKTGSDVAREYVKLVDQDGKEYIGHINELTEKFNLERADDYIKKIYDIKDPQVREEMLNKINPNKLESTFLGTGVGFKKGDVAIQSGLKTKSYELKQATLEEIHKALGFKKFSTNIAETGYLMGARTGRKTAGAEFFDMIRSLGTKADDAPQNYVKLFGDGVETSSDLIKSTAKELSDSGLKFEPEIAQAIDRTYKAYFSDESVNEVLKLYDDLLSGFKSSVTGLFPSFHARNFVSNLWQNYLGGVWKPKHYNESRQIMQDLKMGKTLTSEQQKIWDEYVEQGLKGFGWFGGDASRKIAPELTGETPGFLSKVNQAGLNVGGDIEDFGKLAHYIAKRDMGYSPLDAAMEVKKYLFDYSDLTGFEKNVMKRIFPFYSFTRKNVPMELEAFAQRPAIFSNISKATRGTGGDAEDLPEWMQDRGRLKIGEEGGLQKFLTGGLLDTPQMQPLDLIGEDIPSTIEKTGGSLLSPFIKLPMELAFDENMFFGEPISEVDNIPNTWGEGLYDTPLGDALGVVETDYGYKTSKPQLWHIIRSMGTRPLSSLETGAKISEEDKSRLRQILYLLTGTRVREVDPQQTQYYKKKDEVESLKDFLESQGAIYRGEYFGESK